jgi:hypothetical protein
MRKIHSIVVHHSAGPDTTSVQQIRKRHILNGWRDIGYHMVISRYGGVWDVYQGRSEDQPGAHAGRGFPGNRGSLGVCVCGNYVNSTPPKEALVLLSDLVARWREKYGALRVWGHCDLNATACPGTRLYDLLPMIDQGMTPLRWAAMQLYEVPTRSLAEDRKTARKFFMSNII